MTPARFGQLAEVIARRMYRELGQLESRCNLHPLTATVRWETEYPGIIKKAQTRLTALARIFRNHMGAA